ncbi:MAG: PepSY domain-containing protein [Proteobacteria bacterium]|nr:PepSY domain-containing protein [Pseudomonadota bacterium]
MVAKAFVFVHRWLGIMLCLFFAMWFLTGMVMIYVPFPSLSGSERLQYLDQINIGAIDVDPSQAISLCGGDSANQLRIISLESRPVYVCTDENNRFHITYADTPGKVVPLSTERVKTYAGLRIDAPFVVSKPVNYDQWIVHQRFDPYRPFYRLELVDDHGTHLYMSSQTGEILQRTSSHARFWNYLGAVAHWIYPTVLRKHWAWWDQTVWWLSLSGIVVVLLGIYLGVTRLVKARRSVQKRISPFLGWMRWHHVAGMLSGLLVLSWIFSGWLSMDHGRLFSTSDATDEQTMRIQGISLSDIGSRIKVEDLKRAKSVQEITFHAFGGSAFTISHNSDGVVDPQPISAREIARVVDAVWRESGVVESGVIPKGDPYTDLREGRLPAGTIRVELDDPASTWVHVDSHTGEILSVMDRSRRLYRWLFNGLHSFDVPGLVGQRPLWDFLVLLCLMVGLMGSLTGAVVATRRLFKPR